MKKHSIVLISPNVFSPYSSAVAKGLIENNIHISAIVTVRLINIARILKELRCGKLLLLKRIYNKVLFRNDLTFDGEKKGGVPSMYNISQDYNIPLHFVDSVNGLPMEKILKNEFFSLVVFTGGGVIKPNILKLTNGGVVNCHSGILPYYRGMDCHKWAILNNELDKVGVSCHFMSEKVDRGALIRTKILSINGDDSLSKIEQKMEKLMSIEIVNAVSNYFLQKNKPTEQKIENGKNYYKLHNSLELLVRKKLQNIK